MSLYSISIEKILKFNKKSINQSDVYCYTLNKSLHYLDINVVVTDPTMHGYSLGVDTLRISDEFLKDGNAQFIAAVKMFDTTMINVVRSLQLYSKETIKNYIPSRPLIDVLNKVNLEVPIEIIDKDVRAYFELKGKGVYDDHGSEIEGVICWVEKLNHTYLHVSIFTVDKMPRHIHMPLIPGETFQERYNKLFYSTPKIIPGTDKIDPSFKSNRFISIILNLLLYVVGPNEEFKEQFNRFSPNNKVKQLQLQSYTKSPFIIIGDNIELLRLVRQEETTVSGHFRWQPCGVGRKDIKLVFVNPHLRTYKKFLE